jgi:molybdopterin-guanine dinucleotide biosynthesis protein A
MGTDKALLSIEHQSMIARTRYLLKDTTLKCVVVSRNDGVKGHFSDIITGKGPLSGIHSMLMRFPFDNLLFLPVDLPLIDAATIQLLINTGEQHQQNTRFANGSLPLFIRNGPALRQVLEYTLRCTKHFAVRTFCEHFPIVEVENKIQSKLFNANTPEQWRFAMQHYAMRSPAGVPEISNESFK